MNHTVDDLTDSEARELARAYERVVQTRTEERRMWHTRSSLVALGKPERRAEANRALDACKDAAWRHDQAMHDLDALRRRLGLESAP